VPGIREKNETFTLNGWPLAFLLRPLPTHDRIEPRERDLCWPWTNPVQRALIIASLFWLAVASLSLIDVEALLGRPGWPAVPFWLESILILDWSTLKPWHWVGLIVATIRWRYALDFGQCDRRLSGQDRL